MLTELRISNFALIDQLHLEFPEGFIVLTGETGAGKSLLVDALELIAGGRASAEHIRSGAEQATIEAAFTLPSNSPLIVQLREQDLLSDEGTDLIIRRVLSRNGKNKTYINGALTPIQGVQALTCYLLDIHGQHDQQSLLSAQAQLDVLDGFGRTKTLRDAYTQTFQDWRRQKHALADKIAKRDEQDRHLEMKQFQLHELQEARLQAGEEETLTQEHQRLRYRERIGEIVEQSYQRLYEGEASVVEQFQVITTHIQELETIDASVKEWSSLGETVAVTLREYTDGLRQYRDTLEYDPERLGELDDRIAKLQRLKKKYTASIDELMLLQQELEGELSGNADVEQQIEQLQQQVNALCGQVEKTAQTLSGNREDAARKLEKRISEELTELKMSNVRLSVQIDAMSDVETFGPTGKDVVEFMFSANPGEPLHPLAKIASGGELSRVMLAMKSVLSEADEIPVLVFDEVDAGVGGGVGCVIGKRLRDVAQYHQVFCITHLPQLASQAHAHFHIEKEVSENKTVTRVRQLDDKERENEISRMLGGVEVTTAVRQMAAEMLKTAVHPKKRKSTT
ncbi:MAG: DNA repair protein RecN [Nitrospirales bacterium]|nr:MAG: DNA repair protein RecN [Nitrospirales bacterium]